jgi:hypothetical protein
VINPYNYPFTLVFGFFSVFSAPERNAKLRLDRRESRRKAKHGEEEWKKLFIKYNSPPTPLFEKARGERSTPSF